MAKGLSAAKAKKILTDGYVKGKPLTAKQRKYFGAIASGATPLKAIDGADIEKAQWGKILKWGKKAYENSPLLLNAAKNYPSHNYDKVVNETANLLRKKGVKDPFEVADAIGLYTDKSVIPNNVFRGVKIPIDDTGLSQLNNKRSMVYTDVHPENIMTNNEGMLKMQEYAVGQNLKRLQGIDKNVIGSSDYLHSGAWTSSKQGAMEYGNTGKGIYDDPIFPGELQIRRKISQEAGDHPQGMLQEFLVNKDKPLFGVDRQAMDNIADLISKKLNKPVNEITLKESEETLRSFGIDYFKGGGFRNVPEYHFMPGKMKPTNSKFIYKNGGWLDKYQMGGSLPGASGMMYGRTSGNTPMEPGKLKKAQGGDEIQANENNYEFNLETPVYENLQSFYERNKDLKTTRTSKQSWKGDYDDDTVNLLRKDSSGNLNFNFCEGEQCAARANRVVNAFSNAGSSYFTPSNETKTEFGMGFSTSYPPTEQQIKENPHFINDTNFGSADSWDYMDAVKKTNPSNVLFSYFDEIEGAEKRGEKIDYKTKQKYYSGKDDWKKYNIPMGSYIFGGVKMLDIKTITPEKKDFKEGQHTARVVGYLKSGEPLIADYGEIVPYSQFMSSRPITGIVSVPGKEQHTFERFKKLNENANKKSDSNYWSEKIPEDAGSDYRSYHQGIAGSQNYIQSALNISPEEYERYAKIAMTIPAKESNYGRGKVYNYTDWIGESTGPSQLNMKNVSDKYSKTLKEIENKYGKNTPEYEGVATILYVKELDSYTKNWAEKGKNSQTRPYKRRDWGSIELARETIQEQNPTGYFTNTLQTGMSDTFVYDKPIPNSDKTTREKIRLPYKQLWQDEESYTKEVNEMLPQGLSFKFQDGERVIEKDTKGNTIPNTLEDNVFYSWQSPNNLRYGDAQGDSIYYNGLKDAYQEMYGDAPKQKHGGSTPKSKNGTSLTGGWLDKYEGGNLSKAQNGIKEAINKYLGDPNKEAREFAENPDELSNIDNMRHAQATRLTQEAIANKTGNIPLISDALGFLGSNALGVGHELSTLFGDKDKRDWSTKLQESGEDIFNNLFGSVVGALPMDDKTKDGVIKYASYNNMLPDGYVREEQGEENGFSENVYFKNEDGEIRRPEYKTGGWLDKYQNGGSLPKAQNGNFGGVNTNIQTTSGESAYDDVVQPGDPNYDTKYKDAYNAGAFASMPNQLDEVVINSGVDYEKYPYYNDLSEQDREYFKDEGAIGRGVRRRAQTKEGLAKGTYDVVNPLMYGMMGVAGGMMAGPALSHAVRAGLNFKPMGGPASIGNMVDLGFADMAIRDTPGMYDAYKENPNLGTFTDLALTASDVIPYSEIFTGFKGTKRFINSATNKLNDLTSLKPNFTPIERVVEKEAGRLKSLFNQPNIYPTSSPLPKRMEPYLSQREIPISKKEELLQSTFDWNDPEKLKHYNDELNSRLIRYNQKGEEIIDWRKWVKYTDDFDNNPDVIKHLNEIEETTKANGTWMKNSDGSAFKGTQEEFVIQQSDNFKNAFENNYVKTHHGTPSKTLEEFDVSKGDRITSGDKYPELIFTTDGKNIAREYAGKEGSVLDLYGALGKNKSVDYGGHAWHGNKPGYIVESTNRQGAKYDPFGEISNANNAFKNKKQAEKFLESVKDAPYHKDMAVSKSNFMDPDVAHTSPLTTNKVATRYKDQGFNSLTAKNVVDSYDGSSKELVDVANDYIFWNSNRLKSAKGNILLDMNNPNIYKAIVPGAIGAGAASQMTGPVREDGEFKNGGWLDKYEKGGVIKDDRGQWAHPGEVTEISGNTMATHGYGDTPLYVVPDVGEPRMVEANTGTQTFPGATKFTEYPMAKNGSSLVELNQLTNFTNYNTPQPGGWLDKY